MTHAVLIIDDDERVLQSIRRLLHQDGYEIHLATNGPEALAVLADTDIAVIICDQRMPGMSGAEVLAEAAKFRPDTFRIALTAYADVDVVQKSVNEGGISHFLLKPWDDTSLRKVVQKGVRSYQLIRKNRRFEILTRQQKAELETLNGQLEAQVKERTKKLQDQNTTLVELQGCLENSLRDTVGVLAGMLEAYQPSLGTHSKRVGELAWQLASRSGCTGQVLRDIEFAGHLHDIGKISQFHQSSRRRTQPGAIHRVATPMRHPDCGYAVLSRVNGFEYVASAVQYQQEQYDGSGYPKGLKGENIPLASRIIAVANAYDKGAFPPDDPSKGSYGAGRHVLLEGRGKRFDPQLVTILLKYLDEVINHTTEDMEVEISVEHVKTGMVLSRDIRNVEGVLLLRMGTPLTQQHIENIRALGAVDPLLACVSVRCSSSFTDSSDGTNTSTLPSDEQPQSEVDDSSTKPAVSEPKVLIVDDSLPTCNALVRELRRAHFACSTACNGWDALNLVQQEQFDVVITDLMMPLMKGEDLVTQLHGLAPELPCIIVTGNVIKHEVMHLAKLSNVAGVLIKPWDHDRLINLITSAITEHGRKRVKEHV